MFPLPFSISPLLLSILVFYPWALALGVWGVGVRSNKADRSTSAHMRMLGVRADRSEFTSEEGPAGALTQSAVVIIAAEPTFVYVPVLGTVSAGYETSKPLRGSSFPASPRAPPRYS